MRLRTWPLCGQSRWLVGYIGLVVGSALLMLVVAVATTPLRADDLTTFVALVACAAICVEAMRRLGTPSGLTRDLLGAWWFPAILVLPPLYSLLIPIPVYLLLQFRIRRTVVHRRVFNAASVALSGFVSSVAYHSLLARDLGDVAGVAVRISERFPLIGWGALVAVLCCALFTVMNTAVMAVAVRWSGAETSPRRLMWDREALMVDGAELCVGITVAILCGMSTSLLVIALPPVLLLQRSLLFQQLQTAARTDPKTGLLNAATWEREAGAEVVRGLRARNPTALLVVDIDHFKSVNDAYGHLFGDRVLLDVATLLTHQLRSSDILGRFGGEEFVALLPGADMAEACRAAERLRSRVDRMGMRAGDSSVRVTVSIGVALLRSHGEELVDLLSAADLALYRAKGTGRNRVCLPVGAATGAASEMSWAGPAGSGVPGQPGRDGAADRPAPAKKR